MVRMDPFEKFQGKSSEKQQAEQVQVDSGLSIKAHLCVAEGLCLALL